MAKNGKPARGGEKKSMVGKKNEIDKLIEASKSKSTSLASTSKQTAQKGKALHPQTRQRMQGYQIPRIPSPKKIIPGLPEPQYLILDQRSPGSPLRPLVRLPCESETPRALRHERDGVFKFLELPGEIRNQIYEFAIVKDEYQLVWVNSNHKSKSLTYRHPRFNITTRFVLPKDAAQRRRSLDIKNKPQAVRQRLPSDYYGAIRTTLLLVNKQMHDEAASVFYAKSTFHFHALGTLRHFLDQLTPVAMKSITSLALKYTAYGNPQFTDNKIWKAKHDRLWDNLCWRVADECSLKNLLLDLTLNVAPTTFCTLDEAEFEGIGARWIRPLWAFQDIGLQRCWARLRCASKEDSVLEVESWKLRKDILADKWDEEAESGRDAYGYPKSKKSGEMVQSQSPLVLSINTNVATQHAPREYKERSDAWKRYRGAKRSPIAGHFFTQPCMPAWGDHRF
ncbi:hypothetical protein JMJ35_000928 [Cladonia borealis]|uniref:DUF7730 domain-containing protein n=1 Tax=Cladonia borealis TaxID=184061 RepID=A0AA39R7M3_9LECA|nr:hypothetical protein JMJ35_000928 [Cladonia borealis]